jgi:hypothetical protein
MTFTFSIRSLPAAGLRMRARRIVLSLVSGAIALVVPAHADAPPDQYKTFNQGNDTISDRYTLLEWQRYPSASTTSLASAIAACDAMGAGWRLPSVKELQTLVDERPHLEYDAALGQDVYKFIDRHAFPQTPTGSPYWTSSPAVPSANDYWVVRFDRGTTESRTRTDQALARCVQ